MFEDLRGKCALVTGASAGLGTHLSQVLAGHGVHVILAARRTDKLAALRGTLISNGGSADTIELDVSKADSIDRVASSLDRVPDIVINNAGVSSTQPALEMSADEWDRVLETNLRGTFLVAQAFARRLRTRGKSGAIVNIASITGLRVAGGVSAYAASKAGVIQLTKALALEWARYGIRVNALCPGYIETELNQHFFSTNAGAALIKRIPQRRLGQAKDLDGALLLLASDAGSYISGAVLAVDGGHLVSSL